MALVPFSSYVSDVAPHVDGCPSPVISSYIRKVVADLCERAKVWRTPLAGVVLTAGTSSYPLVSPIAETEVSSILDVKYAKASATGRYAVAVRTQEEIFALYPEWPLNVSEGEPRDLYREDLASFQVAPYPDAVDTYTIYVQAAIRPTIGAVNVENSIMSEYRRIWFHGALHELFLIPNRTWSSEKMATYHGKQWTYFLSQARAKANKGFGRVSISVQQRPWA